MGTPINFDVIPQLGKLRHEAFARDNALVWASAWFYTFDTNANVCLSLHRLRCGAVCASGLSTALEVGAAAGVCYSGTEHQPFRGFREAALGARRPVRCLCPHWAGGCATGGQGGIAEIIGGGKPVMGDNYFLLTNLLSEDERKVITSIASHIERGEKRVGIQQIANENFLSTTSIVKMCKRLGFDGYSELYYHLSRQLASSGDQKAENLKSLIDNYDDALVERFCALLRERRSGKMFTTGEGFSNIVGTYITQRLSICGFMAFNNVHFYDYMLFQEAHRGAVSDEAAVMFAVSQSGETEPVLNDVRHAKRHGHKIVTFTRRGDSTLAQLSDLVFVLDGTKQTLAGSLPNPFFGHVILVFEDLMARYFERKESV